MILGCGFIDVDRFQKKWSLLLKEVHDQDDCSFTWKSKGKDFRKGGLKRKMVYGQVFICMEI